MIGQEGVCRAIVDRLNTSLADEAAKVAASVGAQPFPVPHPDNVFPYWTNLVESLDRLPAIMVLIEDTDTTTSTRQIDESADHDEYAHQYPVAVVILNTGDHYGDVELHRQRLMLTVRNTLLRHQLLISAGDEEARIDPDTLREAPTFGAQNEQTGQWLLESAIRVRVRTQEHLDILEDHGPAAPVINEDLFG